ncbi:MAG: C2 family cysteine protease [Planctomyces sp.]
MVALSRIPACFAWLTLLLFSGNGAGTALPSEFADIIARRFSKWDLNRDRVLTVDVINRAVSDVTLRDSEAAAIAALKRGLAGHSALAKGVSKDRLQQMVDDRDATGQELQELFKAAEKRIRLKQPRLFASGRPQLETIHQGRLGNCFVLAPLGAVLAVSPDRISQMFTSGPADGYYVRFGRFQIPVPALTDAELALTAGNEDAGIWVNVYEKAAGAAQQVIGPSAAAKGSAIDAISSGGSVTRFLSLITGRQIQRFSFEFARRHDSNARPYRDGLRQLRTWLDDARREHHAMVCTTRESRTPGISSNHAWAVVAWDNTSDVLTLWNPHGGNFRPAGSSGPVHGYPASQGMLKIPLADFVRLFSGMARETDTPAAGTRELPALPDPS